VYVYLKCCSLLKLRPVSRSHL